MENTQKNSFSNTETKNNPSSHLETKKHFKPFYKKKPHFKHKKPLNPSSLNNNFDYQEEDEVITNESLSDKKNYIFFQFIQNHYLEESKFIQNIEEFLKNQSIDDLIFLEKNLLIYCCLYNNEKAFNILLPYYLKSEDKNSLLYQCLFFLLPNKNPYLLEQSLNNIDHLDDEKMNTLLQFFAKNCYRKENSVYFTQWLSKKEIFLKRFILELFEYNNISFLKHFKEINFSLLQKYKDSLIINSFNLYQKSSFEQIFNIPTPLVEQETPIITKILKEEPTIIIKKRKKEITL